MSPVAEAGAFLRADLIVDDGHPTKAGDQVALAASICAECGRSEFPARRTCVACLTQTEPVALRAGTLMLRTAVLHPPPGGLVEVPYEIGVAEFRQVGLAVIGLLDTPDCVDIGDALGVHACAVGEHLTFAFGPLDPRGRPERAL